MTLTFDLQGRDWIQLAIPNNLGVGTLRIIELLQSGSIMGKDCTFSVFRIFFLLQMTPNFEQKFSSLQKFTPPTRDDQNFEEFGAA